jgi:hypothetical protein
LQLLPLISETLLTTEHYSTATDQGKKLKHFGDKSAASSNPKKTDTTLMKQQLTTAQCEAAEGKKKKKKNSKRMQLETTS